MSILVGAAQTIAHLVAPFSAPPQNRAESGLLYRKTKKDQTMTMKTNLKTTTAKALLERSLTPISPILEPWLRNEETCILWAATGVGKTMFSLSIALAVAGGGSLGDWEAPEARRVLYIDGEMNIRDLQERVRTLVEGGSVVCSAEQRRLALQNLTLIVRQDQDLGTDFYDITNDEDQDRLIQQVKDQYDLVILDNFTTLSADLADENDSTAFKSIQKLFLELKRAGVSAILVHHANKGGQSMRGSTALEATFEIIVGLKKPKVSAPGQAKFRVEFTKFRSKGDIRLEPRMWTLKETGWAITDELPDDPKDDPVYSAVKKMQFTSMQEIGDALGVSKATVSRRLKVLNELGVLKEAERRNYFEKAKELRQAELAGQFVSDSEDLLTNEPAEGPPSEVLEEAF